MTTEKMNEKPTPQAIRECAEWLATCLELGWRKSDLDALEAMWWKYHDHRGNLRSDEKGSR
jgi:hypothetical protein